MFNASAIGRSEICLLSGGITGFSPGVGCFDSLPYTTCSFEMYISSLYRWNVNFKTFKQHLLLHLYLYCFQKPHLRTYNILLGIRHSRIAAAPFATSFTGQTPFFLGGRFSMGGFCLLWFKGHYKQKRKY